MAGANGSASMDWDDVRVFLAVARHGSLRAAGRALGLSQPTIGRRLAAFEATFGGPTLFDRLPEGLRLNAAGDALMPVAEELESAALARRPRRRSAAPSAFRSANGVAASWLAISTNRAKPGCHRPSRSSSSNRGKRLIWHVGTPTWRCATASPKAEI